MTAVSRQVAITNQRGLHARASAKFVNLASQIDAQDRGREGRPPGLRDLDHGPDDARRGDGRYDRHPLSRATRPKKRSTKLVELVEDQLRRRMMARQVTAFSNTTVKLLRSLRDKKARRAEGLFLAEGLRILAEARDSGRLPEIVAFSAGGSQAPARRRDHCGDRGRGRRRDRDDARHSFQDER